MMALIALNLLCVKKLFVFDGYKKPKPKPLYVVSDSRPIEKNCV